MPNLTSPSGLLKSAFYVAANGFSADAMHLIPSCRELAYDVGDESLLQCLATREQALARRANPVKRPRLLAVIVAAKKCSHNTEDSAGADCDVEMRVLLRIDTLLSLPPMLPPHLPGMGLLALDDSGRSCLMHAALYGRSSVLRQLLSYEAVASPQFVNARIAPGLPDEGHCAFSLACQSIAAAPTGTSLAEHGKCVRELLPRVSLESLGGEDASLLSWAISAGVCFKDACYEVADIKRRDALGHTAFSRACLRASSASHQHERDAASNVAMNLSKRMAAADLGGLGATSLSWACEARLLTLVLSWLEGCPVSVALARDPSGSSSFARACLSSIDETLSSSEQDTAVCVARVLAQVVTSTTSSAEISDALEFAFRAGLDDLVRVWTRDLCVLSPPPHYREPPPNLTWISVQHELCPERETLLSCRERYGAMRECAHTLAVEGHQLVRLPSLRSALLGMAAGLKPGARVEQCFRRTLDDKRAALAYLRRTPLPHDQWMLRDLELDVAGAEHRLGEYAWLCLPHKSGQEEATVRLSAAHATRLRLLGDNHRDVVASAYAIGERKP